MMMMISTDDDDERAAAEVQRWGMATDQSRWFHYSSAMQERWMVSALAEVDVRPPGMDPNGRPGLCPVHASRGDTDLDHWQAGQSNYDHCDSTRLSKHYIEASGC